MIDIKNTQSLVKTSYNKDDATILLKDLTGLMNEMSAEEREKAIQNGKHYSEMLPEEKEPSKEYEALYNKALTENKFDIAYGIAIISEMIYNNTIRGRNKQGEELIEPIIISLARAGTPIGILIKRYFKQRYNKDIPHYSISIVRDKGIDTNAMEFIFNTEIKCKHRNLRNIFFIDGWTGKGVIKQQLDESIQQLREIDSKWNELQQDNFVVWADPSNITKFCAIHDDYMLPSACLNSTVSGLTSRTILNSMVNINSGDFHGAVYFKKFEQIDKSNEFIDTITKEFDKLDVAYYTYYTLKEPTGLTGMEIVEDICKQFNITDYKKIKPGIGETTRVLLRRLPWKVLINKDISMNDPDIQHILLLCKEKNIETMKWDLGNYKVCGIIKDLNADA